MELGIVAGFEDFFPSIIEKLGGEGFMVELCDGLRSLIDKDKELITIKSLKRGTRFPWDWMRLETTTSFAC
ncbi:hypothetical protein SLE2022_394690 [Rubroshorea leprosula]